MYGETATAGMKVRFVLILLAVSEIKFSFMAFYNTNIRKKEQFQSSAVKMKYCQLNL